MVLSKEEISILRMTNQEFKEHQIKEEKRIHRKYHKGIYHSYCKYCVELNNAVKQI